MLEFIVATFLLASQSPPVPPAGVVDRQLEQEYELKEVEPKKTVPLLEFDLPEEELEVGGEKVTIYKVEVLGRTAIKERYVQRCLRGYLNKPISMREMKEMCQAIQRRYAEEGYFLTRAYLPPQEVQGGVLRVKVIEGKLGNVSVMGNKFYSTAFIKRHFKRFQGKPIHYDQILRALFLLDDNSDLEVGAVFKKGEAFGTADLIVRVADKRPLHLVQDTNNYGSDHTTHQRTGTRIDYGNLIADGDMLTLIGVLGSPISHLNFADGIYHVPLNAMGMSMDFSYLCANFKTDRVNQIRYVGTSHIGGVKLNQALGRTRRLNTDVFCSFDVKQVQNFGGGKRTSYDKLRVLTGGVLVDYVDGLKGRNQFTLSGGWGIPGFFGGSSVKSPDSSREGGGGHFFKINGRWKREQAFPWQTFLLISGHFQLSVNKLPLPEEIYIGGVDTVRGYPLAVGLGDSGYYGTVEFHMPLPFLQERRVPWCKTTTWGEFLQFVGFVDMGQTFVIGSEVLRELSPHHKRKTVFDDRVMLLSAGPGIRLHGPWNLDASLDIGFPLTRRHRSSNTILYFRVAWQLL